MDTCIAAKRGLPYLVLFFGSKITLNSCSLLVTSSGSSAGVRKSSSMSMSSGVVVPQASSVAQGGSLKKESLANLHLLSATNESRVSQQEIKQQIPVKLSSKLSVSAASGTGSKVRPSDSNFKAQSSEELKRSFGLQGF